MIKALENQRMNPRDAKNMTPKVDPKTIEEVDPIEKVYAWRKTINYEEVSSSSEEEEDDDNDSNDDSDSEIVYFGGLVIPEDDDNIDRLSECKKLTSIIAIEEVNKAKSMNEQEKADFRALLTEAEFERSAKRDAVEQDLVIPECEEDQINLLEDDFFIEKFACQLEHIKFMGGKKPTNLHYSRRDIFMKNMALNGLMTIEEENESKNVDLKRKSNTPANELPESKPKKVRLGFEIQEETKEKNAPKAMAFKRKGIETNPIFDPFFKKPKSEDIKTGEKPPQDEEKTEKEPKCDDKTNKEQSKPDEDKKH